VLGLGLPFPSSATPLSLSNVASTLFSKNHLSLLAASFFPAFFLSVSVRSRYIELWTRGLIRSPYYIPVYLLMIPTVFWIVAPAAGISRESLMSAGWLFTVDTASVSSSSGLVASWNYWALFDFVSSTPADVLDLNLLSAVGRMVVAQKRHPEHSVTRSYWV
jgi:SulP family sulfate permease